MSTITDTTILDCGHTPSEHTPHTTGYGTDSKGHTYCYSCCARLDNEQMLKDGQIALYLSDSKVTNWPGSLEFTVTCYHKGKHNIAVSRHDVWFTGPDNHVWHGVQYGNWTQICHCKRTKEVIKA